MNITFSKVDFKFSCLISDVYKRQVELSANYSGFGVAYYINTDKSTVDLSEYDSIVFNITSEGPENGDSPVVFSTKNNIQNDSYWGNGSTEANVRYNTIVTGTQDYTYTDWSGEAQAVFIKYNTYGSDRTDAAKFTVNSIKLVKNTDVCVYKACLLYTSEIQRRTE